MRIAAHFDDPEFHEILDVMIPGFLLNSEVVAIGALAPVVIVESLHDAAALLQDGRYVVHYCTPGCSSPHEKSITGHERFRLVLHEDGKGGTILMKVLAQIELEVDADTDAVRYRDFFPPLLGNE